MGRRISDLTLTRRPASRSMPSKDYVVAGWASVNEGTEGPPIWDVVDEPHPEEDASSHRAKRATFACWDLNGWVTEKFFPNICKFVHK